MIYDDWIVDWIVRKECYQAYHTNADCASEERSTAPCENTFCRGPIHRLLLIRFLDLLIAAMSTKKPCAKCTKGIGILTCDGCQQSFCTKHIVDHRQELSVKMDTIGQEFDLLRQELIRDGPLTHPLLARIDVWEQESIRKIQQSAQKARDDLGQYVNRSQIDIKERCKRITDELQSTRDSGDYTEVDFQSWTDQLAKLRSMAEKPLILDLVDDEKTPTPIHLVQIRERSEILPSAATAKPWSPRAFGDSATLFSQFVGNATFSVDRRLARHTGEADRSTMVCITQLYSSGMSQVDFGIESKTNRYLFFGIVHGREETTRAVFQSPSLHGWMSPSMRVISSRKLPLNNNGGYFLENSVISLILNCNIAQLSLVQNRTNILERLPIDLRLCPLPWRIVVAFFSPQDSVRVLPSSWLKKDDERVIFLLFYSNRVSQSQSCLNYYGKKRTEGSWTPKKDTFERRWCIRIRKERHMRLIFLSRGPLLSLVYWCRRHLCRARYGNILVHPNLDPSYSSRSRTVSILRHPSQPVEQRDRGSSGCNEEDWKCLCDRTGASQHSRPPRVDLWTSMPSQSLFHPTREWTYLSGLPLLDLTSSIAFQSTTFRPETNWLRSSLLSQLSLM